MRMSHGWHRDEAMAVGEVAGPASRTSRRSCCRTRERLELNEGKEISLVPGLERLRREVFEALDYDTVVVLDSHWHTTVEFVVAAQPMPGRPVHLRRAAARDVPDPVRLARATRSWPRRWPRRPTEHGTWITAIDDPCLPVHYATVNLWSYLGRGLDKRWVSVSTAQTGDTEDFLRAGRALGAAIAATTARCC